MTPNQSLVITAISDMYTCLPLRNPLIIFIEILLDYWFKVTTALTY